MRGSTHTTAGKGLWPAKGFRSGTVGVRLRLLMINRPLAGYVDLRAGRDLRRQVTAVTSTREVSSGAGRYRTTLAAVQTELSEVPLSALARTQKYTVPAAPMR